LCPRPRVKKKIKKERDNSETFSYVIQKKSSISSTFKFSNTQTGTAKITAPKITVDTSEKECNLLSNKFMDKNIGSTDEVKVHSSAAHHYISASAETTVGCKVPALLYEDPS
jgi:hypothetical protein